MEYGEPLATGTFPRQRKHGPYSVHRVDGCTRTFLRLFLKIMSWTSEETNCRQQRKNEQCRQAAQRPPQSGVYTAQHTIQQPGIPQPAYISALSVGCGILTALWLVRHRLISKKQYHGNLNVRRLLHSFQVTVRTNLLAELKHQAPNSISDSSDRGLPRDIFRFKTVWN